MNWLIISWTNFKTLPFKFCLYKKMSENKKYKGCSWRAGPERMLIEILIRSIKDALEYLDQEGMSNIGKDAH
jgi:hypothetical protein